MPQAMVESLLQELKAGLTALYDRQLHGVYVFGSYARGEQDVESDLDILIVLTSFERLGIEIERTGLLISHLSLKYGVSISRKFISKEYWESANTTLLRNLHAEAIAA